MPKKCTPLWREAHFQVKMYKTPHVRATFGGSDVEKVHAVVARRTFPSQNVKNTRGSDHFWKLRCRKSKMYKTLHVRATFGGSDVEKVHAVVARRTFPSQNVKNTRGSDHFWKLRCRKSARCCGAKHISKSKCTKHYMFAPLLEVQMSKKCTPLWREAHFEVKMLKASGVRTTFGGSDVASLHYTTLHYTTLHYTTLHYTTLHYTTLQLQLHNYTPLHSTTLNYTTLHYTTLRSTTLHYTTLHYLPLHFTTLHYTTTTTTTTQLHSTTIHSTTLHYTKLHYITLHYTPLHYTTLHYTTFHYTSLHYTTLHSTTLQLQLQLQLRLRNYTPLHEITLHYTTLHYTTLHYTTLH